MKAKENLATTDSAATLAAKIRRKEVSPVEVMDAAIARIETHNSKINALIVLHLEEARKSAKAADAAVMRGDKLGPLFGVPVAMKDCFDFKPGWVCTFGVCVRSKTGQPHPIACGHNEWRRRAQSSSARQHIPIFGFRGTCGQRPVWAIEKSV